MKVIIVIFVLGILVAMGSAMVALLRHKGSSKSTVRALTIRVALSVCLFLVLMLSFKMGWIHPHGVTG